MCVCICGNLGIQHIIKMFIANSTVFYAHYPSPKYIEIISYMFDKLIYSSVDVHYTKLKNSQARTCD